LTRASLIAPDDVLLYCYSYQLFEYFSTSHAYKHRENIILMEEMNLASEQLGAPISYFCCFETTLTVSGISSKSQILYLEPLLATHQYVAKSGFRFLAFGTSSIRYGGSSKFEKKGTRARGCSDAKLRRGIKI
jgi:hypothetical protein